MLFDGFEPFVGVSLGGSMLVVIDSVKTHHRKPNLAETCQLQVTMLRRNETSVTILSTRRFQGLDLELFRYIRNALEGIPPSKDTFSTNPCLT